MALALPAGGSSLISCPLASEAASLFRANTTVAISRAWLDDQGGEQVEQADEGMMLPEELSSLQVVPCGPKDSGSQNCLVVGTTGQRVVQMAADGSQTAAAPVWLPKRLLHEHHGDAFGPGAFAVVEERYLAMLHRNSSRLRLLDLHGGGQEIASWGLPLRPGGSKGGWASICAGGDAVYALEDRAQPELWRFPLPKAQKPVERLNQASILSSVASLRVHREVGVPILVISLAVCWVLLHRWFSGDSAKEERDIKQISSDQTSSSASMQGEPEAGATEEPFQSASTSPECTSDTGPSASIMVLH